MVKFPGTPDTPGDSDSVAGGSNSNRRGRRAASRGKSTGKRKGPPPDAIVSLTPKGRAYFDALLAAASAEAGRQLTGEDLLEAMRRVKAETGIAHPDFSQPATLECFKKHVRGIGGTED